MTEEEVIVIMVEHGWIPVEGLFEIEGFVSGKVKVSMEMAMQYIEAGETPPPF